MEEINLNYPDSRASKKDMLGLSANSTTNKVGLGATLTNYMGTAK